MKTLVAFSLLFCAFNATAQTAAKLTPQPWAGCYEIRAADANGPEQIYGKKLPWRFQLLSAPFATEFGVRDLHTDKAQRWPFSSWKPSGDDGFILDSGTGFVGCKVTVFRSGDTLLGTAQPWSDDGSEPAQFKVTARRYSCPPLR